MYNVPILKPDEVIRAGSWVIVSNIHCLVNEVKEDMVWLTPAGGHRVAVSLSGLYDSAILPQAQYCIWKDAASYAVASADTDTTSFTLSPQPCRPIQEQGCTCGAKHTSFPNQHMSYCAL